MLVGRYKLLGRRATGKKDPLALGLALVFDDGAELQYVDEKRMGKVYVARAADEAQIPVYGKLGLDLLSPAFTREAFGKAIAQAARPGPRVPDGQGRAGLDRQRLRRRDPLRGRLHPKTFCGKLDARRDRRALRGHRQGAGGGDRRDPRGATSRSTSRCATSSRCAGATASPAGLRHHDPRRARRRRRRLLLPHLPARDPQALRQLVGVPGRAPPAAPEGTDEKAKPTAFSKRFLAPKR